MSGRLFGLGVGPGDPELITVKALRLLRQVQVVAYPCARHGQSNARSIVCAELTQGQIEIPMMYPITTEQTEHPGGYETAISEFYDEMAEQIASHLTEGRDVAILCEGDPFFYGSYMYLHDRLATRFPTEVIPGVPSVMGAAARLGNPLVRRDTGFTVLTGTMSEEYLVEKLGQDGAFAIMKLGRNFAKVKRALEQAGLLKNALYIERATMAAEHSVPLAEVDPQQVPYFSIILVPDASQPQREQVADSPGWIAVVGLGPGAAEWLTPEARQALVEATDLVGYHTYLDRVPERAGQRRFGSDNKVEADRARHALSLAEAGRRVCVVSSGAPGIVAMASAVLECVDQGPPAWRALDLRILPGLSAMQAAASRVGAPLGHDFCVLSLSDRLKPWEMVVKRLEAAARADFAIAIYNPISSERLWQLAEARSIVSRHRGPETPVILARSVGRSDERVVVTDLDHFDPAQADMQTVVLIGSSTTREISMQNGQKLIYTPRSYGESSNYGPSVKNETPSRLVEPNALECWLRIVGIGEDGWEGLTSEARQAVASAEVLYGSIRHLNFIPAGISCGSVCAWPSPMAPAVEHILTEHRGRKRITVLASGDPMFYGVGVSLTRALLAGEFQVIPQVSVLSLACARLGWSIADTNVISLVSRPVEQIHRHLHVGQRIIVLSESGRSPLEVATLLTGAGFGSSQMTLLANLGGPSECVRTGMAVSWDKEACSDLNVVAILCVRDAMRASLPLTVGLPDSAFETDGQFTKREVRAVTLSRLAPTPGQLLWDVGAGSGTIGIEWMRVHAACSCVAFEHHAERAARVRRNAARLGVPGLKVMEGSAPLAFVGLPAPDAIFMGGGVGDDELFDACWAALTSGGLMVANAVTIESEARLIARHARYGGDLMRMMVSRADPVGGLHGWRPMMPITQWTATKP
jgi:precorrin-2 C20-methyltransferase/precorrin-3B C17-methyltransferase